MICKNCKQNFDGNFCNNCGQKHNVERLNFNYLINEISNNILQVNRGIFFTIKELTIRPGHTIRDFLNGKRKQHFKPLAFILFTSAVYVLITYFTNPITVVEEALSGITDALSNNGEKLSITANILNWLLSNFAYSTLLLIPIFSFASYICFLKEKYNYIEHLILNFYISGQQIIIYLTFAALYYIFGIDGYYKEIIPVIVATLFIFWTYIQFFKNHNFFLKISLTILTYILNFILIMIMIVIIVFIEVMIKR